MQERILCSCDWSEPVLPPLSSSPSTAHKVTRSPLVQGDSGLAEQPS